MLTYLNKVKVPLLLLALLVSLMYFGSYVPVEVKSFSYAISLSIKTILEFVLPFIIFSFVFYCLSNLQKGAIFFVFLLITTVFVSNFSALMFGYTSGYLGLNFMHFSAQTLAVTSKLLPT